jgi:regulator of replication initiation timing
MFFRKKTLERENAELQNQVENLLKTVESLLKTIDTFRTRFETLAELENARKEVYEDQIKVLEERLAYTDEQFNKAIANEESRADEMGEILYGKDGWKICKESVPDESPVSALFLAVRCDRGKSNIRFLDTQSCSKNYDRLMEALQIGALTGGISNDKEPEGLDF